MPLADHLPQIDDRRYDDIVTEIRTRIARYAPEWRPGESAWTDVNENDPGVTLAQVFAWQADMLLYRLGKVPALAYLKFLELIGIQLQPAEPARAEVTLPVLASHGASTVIIPARTQLSADPGDGGPLLVFETNRALVALRARLEAVVLAEQEDEWKEAGSLALTLGFRPFGTTAPEGAAMALGFDDSGALPDGELDLAVTVTAQAPQGGAWLQCGTNQRFAPATLRWEYWNGSGWTGLKLLEDETLALSRSGHVRLRLPPSGQAAKTKLIPSQPKTRYWVRAVVVASQYERAPQVRSIRTNTVAVEQAETLRDEVLGGSDGSRHQQFRLSAQPVLAGSLELEIQQGDEGFQRWKEVDDFYAAGPTDQVYVLDRTTGVVLTGDGVHASIPVAYVANSGANVVARVYRVGGGRRGNVPARAIASMVSPVPGIDGSKIGNLAAAFGGRDEETLEEAKLRAPRALKSRARAVTTDDFEYLARQAGNVARSRALALHHPGFPGTPVPGVMSVIVVPDSDAAQPMPSDGTLRAVCAYLDARRLLTTELYVLRPVYQDVAVRGEVVVADGADLAQVSAAIEEALLRYFHPLHGGEDGQGWPFGGTIFYSRVYQRIFAIEGVASIATLTISVDGVDAPPCTDVPLAANALTSSTSHGVDVRYPGEDER